MERGTPQETEVSVHLSHGEMNTMEVAVGDGSAAPIGIGGIDAVLQHAGLRAVV